MAGEESQSAERKTLLSSKTIGVNLGAPLALQAATEIFPQLGPWVATHPQTLVLAMAGLNILMRHLTAGGLRYAPKKDPTS